MSSKGDFELSDLARLNYERDNSHVWGNYFEVTVNPYLIVRCLSFYPRGATSLHSHSPEELLLVTHGTVHVSLGIKPDKLDSDILGVGQTIFIPSGYYHRVEHIGDSGEASRALELMSKSEPGDYDIRRASGAVPGIVSG